jgi:hypothetical protein
MVGGGTSVEVAHEMGIVAHGLDLHSGFNILKQRILDVVGKPSDLVLSHPPYHNIVVYGGNVWSKGPVLDDLLRCATEHEFPEKLTIALKNQRHATMAGGYYGTIIGDVRRGGAYSSDQADMVLDAMAGETQKRSRKTLRPGGILVSILGLEAPPPGAKHAQVFVQPNATVRDRKVGRYGQGARDRRNGFAAGGSPPCPRTQRDRPYPRQNCPPRCLTLVRPNRRRWLPLSEPQLEKSVASPAPDAEGLVGRGLSYSSVSLT